MISIQIMALITIEYAMTQIAIVVVVIVARSSAQLRVHFFNIRKVR